MSGYLIFCISYGVVAFGLNDIDGLFARCLCGTLGVGVLLFRIFRGASIAAAWFRLFGILAR